MNYLKRIKKKIRQKTAQKPAIAYKIGRNITQTNLIKLKNKHE